MATLEGLLRKTLQRVEALSLKLDHVITQNDELRARVAALSPSVDDEPEADSFIDATTLDGQTARLPRGPCDPHAGLGG